MKALAIDPGKRTGWCFGTVDAGIFKIEPGEAEISLSRMYEMLSNFIGRGGGHIIYEDFSYRNHARAGLDLSPVKIIGIIELYREWHEPFITFSKQSAATGKAFYNDERLKQLGVYWGHGKGHARDATRHLLQWANFTAGAGMGLREMPMEMIDTHTK